MSKVFFASDHAGFVLKSTLVSYIQSLGYPTEDMGPHTFDSEDDYPDFVTPCAQRVVQEGNAVGIVLGKSGQGEAMAANRTKDARAIVFYGGDLEIVRLAREHNNANILSLGAGFLDVELAKQAIQLFLTTPFSGESRHVRRLAKF